jgi:hypothetical protein
MLKFCFLVVLTFVYALSFVFSFFLSFALVVDLLSRAQGGCECAAGGRSEKRYAHRLSTHMLTLGRGEILAGMLLLCFCLLFLLLRLFCCFLLSFPFPLFRKANRYGLMPTKVNLASDLIIKKRHHCEFTSQHKHTHKDTRTRNTSNGDHRADGTRPFIFLVFA